MRASAPIPACPPRSQSPRSRRSPLLSPIRRPAALGPHRRRGASAVGACIPRAIRLPVGQRRLHSGSCDHRQKMASALLSALRSCQRSSAVVGTALYRQNSVPRHLVSGARLGPSPRGGGHSSGRLGRSGPRDGGGAPPHVRSSRTRRGSRGPGALRPAATRHRATEFVTGTAGAAWART